MVILEERYEKILKKPWRTIDLILYPYGRLRPKAYGEILFSEEWNYLAETLAWLYTIKMLLPPKIKRPLVSLSTFKITPHIAWLVYQTFKFPSEIRTEWADISLDILPRTHALEFADISQSILSRQYGTKFPDFSGTLASISSSISTSGRPGTILSKEYNIIVQLKQSIGTLNDIPTKEVVATTASVSTHTGQAAGDIYLDLLYREAFIYLEGLRSASYLLETMAKEIATRLAGATLYTLSKTLGTSGPSTSLPMLPIDIRTASPQASVQTMTKQVGTAQAQINLSTFGITVSTRVQ